MNIKDYIINNFKNDNYKEIRDQINESVSSNSESTLPGEGVIFELLWNNSDNELKDQIIETIRKAILKETF